MDIMDFGLDKDFFEGEQGDQSGIVGDEDAVSNFDEDFLPGIDVANSAMDYPANFDSAWVKALSDLPDLPGIVGSPDIDAPNWHIQQSPDTCAIVSQEYILESMTGQEFHESDLVEISIEEGFYYPGLGTYPEDVGGLLEYFDIETEASNFSSFDDIVEKLDNDQKIIVGLDANEIWANSAEEQLAEQLIDLFFLPEANHAVQVIGFNSESQEVILNDPGHPNGQGMAVHLNDFNRAWNDSGNFTVWTKESTA